MWAEGVREQGGEIDRYLSLRGRKEQGTCDSYINYVQFVCCGCCRVEWREREKCLCLRRRKEKGTSDSYIKYVEFVG